MKKVFLLTLLFALIGTLGFSQTDQAWSANTAARSSITPDKAVARLAYPKIFKLFNLDIAPLRKELFSVVDGVAKHSTIISLPNADGGIEQFEVWEAPNFEPSLQAQFPEIRAFSGTGITNKGSMLKLSISPSLGISTMVFRTEKESEFIEAYSNDHTVYSVYKSQREKNKLPWTCTTEDKALATDIVNKFGNPNSPTSNDGNLRTMRLAQSCNGEYSNFFGAFNIGQIALTYAAFNTTLSRCNGCYEKDLAVHLNLIANSFEQLIIFFDPATDPYTTLANWNAQLQALLNAQVGDPNYDIGHMFGASGGGGNAGCIGCVCVAGQKGSGITSPADGIPMGDNFDIDYVVHEVGHQMGGNHSFTFSNEGTAVQTEVGAGITIMGYAGITSYDPAPHSIDIYTGPNISQIQANLIPKVCPVVTNITANNATPVVAPLLPFTVPMQTPFALTASATDANPGDVLTYCWEQIDLHGGQTAANSVAYAAKPVGPNFLTLTQTTSPTRMFPRLSTVLAGLQITPPFPGGDAICNIEALSNVSRTETFRVTVRDNHAYSPTVPIAVAQTAFQSMTLTITNTSGPFSVTIPNTNVTWTAGSSQTITWAVANTTAAPVSCANVKISLSTDGGTTFPTVLAASTLNDGTETLTIPGPATTTARIKIEAVGNIFFDIDDANFTITAPTTTSDLAITKTDGVTTYTPGGTTTYTIVATNAGPDPVVGATVADVFPAAITSVAWTAVYAGGASGPAAGAGNINATVNIPTGGSCTFTAVCNISGAASGNLVNTATVTPPAGVTDPTPGNNSATDTDTQANTADLSITKTDGTTTYTAGGTTTYTIVASNAGPNLATGATVADVFPAAITSVAWTAVYAGGASGPASGAGNINATVNLPSGGTATFTAVCNISGAATGNLINTATVTAPGGLTDPNLANNSATDTDSPPLAGCGNWVASTVIPIPILDEAVVGLGANLYSFAGVSNSGVVTNSYKFDGTTWTAIAAYPVAVEYPAAVTNGTDIYIMGGALTGTGVPQTSLFRYNVGANTYTPLASFTTATWNQTAVYLNGKIYKFGGTLAAGSTAALEIYDIAGNSWTNGAAMPQVLSFAGGFTDGTFIYVVGGLDAGSTTPSLKTYRYTVGTNIWDDAGIADLPATRWGPAYGWFNSAGIIAGGYVGGAATANISTSALQWNPGTNSWVPLNNMVGERARMNGGAIGASFYVVGGRSVASAAFVGTNDNQKLTCGGPAVLVAAPPTVLISESCVPPNSAIDPGEIVSVSFCVQNTGGSNTANLVGTLQNTGGVTGAGAPQTYGVVVAGGAAVCRTFSFTANGSCGNTITASIQLQDGATNLGTVTFTLQLGALNTVTIMSQNWDAVVAPALPAGWTTAATGVEVPWVTSVITPVSAPNDAFAPDVNNIGNTELFTPTIAIPAGATPKTLTFQNLYNLENGFDGMVLEISINGGAYQDIITAGGAFTAGGYVGVISSTFGSPIAGRNAWTTLSGGTTAAPAYITSTCTLPAAANGQNIVLKWRVATDNSAVAAGVAGVRIDNIVVSTSSYVCCNPVTTADLAITKTDGVTTYTPGASTTYTIVASNAGPSAVVGATVTDNFPAGIASVNWTAAYAGGASGPASGSGNINATVNLPVGGTATFTAVCVISPAATGNLVNTATVSFSGTDPTPGNNSATDTDTQNPATCLENFDLVTVPNLPGGWTTTTNVVNAASNKWATASGTSSSAPNAATTNDPPSISDEIMNSRSYAVPAGAAQLIFKNNYNLEASGGSFFDGMVLELSINAGAFADIITAGGSFVSGGYVGVISGGFGNPLAGRNSWSGNSGGFISTAVNLPAGALGQNVVFRWRRASDNSVAAVGAWIDDVYVIASASISYPGSPYCTSGGTANVTQTGAAGGTYSSTAGLTLNPATGAVTLGTSTPNTYTVTYTIPASGNCPAFVTTTTITITTGPTATINYASNPYCTSSGTATVTQTGTAGGTYSSTAGLTLNPATGAVTLGTSTPGNYTVTYTIAASGGCAAFNTTAPISIYNCNCTENFDGVVAPVLPANWTASSGVVNAASNKWATAPGTVVSAPNAATTNDPGSISDEYLDSKTYPITSPTAQLTFKNNYNLEASGGSFFDGMVLEISINAGAFTDIITAGGSFVAGGYVGVISLGFGSPIAGRNSWSGNSGGFITTTVNLPAAANGQNVKFRWRRGTDNSVGAVGAWIDDISLSGSNCTPPCVITCPANIVQSNDVNQCGAVVTYTAPTTSGFCGPVVATPASGSFFPIGTTPVHAYINDCNTVYAVNTTNQLLTFNTATPGSISSTVAITGLVAGDNVLGIDFRPATGGLYGLGVNGAVAHLYTIDKTTAVATQVGGNIAVINGGAFAAYGFDFNPVVDRIRVTSNNDENFRLNPVTGAVAGVDATINPPSATVTGGAYSNNWVGATQTTLYGIDVALDQLVIQGSVNGTPLSPNTGTVTTVGPLGFDAANANGFDITSCNGTAYAVLFVSGTSRLYTINLASGAGTLVGQVGAGGQINAMAIAPSSAQCSFTVQVNDVQPPVVTCPANIVVGNDPNQCGAVVNYTPTATDNCPGVTIVSSPASGSFFPVGTTTVTVTATDASGNTATCTFTVRVNDTQGPTINCPSTDLVVSNDPNQCGAVVNFPTPGVTDNCPGAITVTVVPPSGSFFPVGTTVVTVTATDLAGNVSICTFKVRVVDTQLPVVTCPANITVSNTAGQCGAIVTWAAPIATDNCPGVTVTSSPASGSFFPVGTTTVTVTARDASNNVKTCTFTVTVNDTQLPTITCPANIVVVNTQGQCGAIVVYPGPQAADNCPGFTVTSTPASGSFFPVGTTTVTCTVTDASGNTATCTFTIRVNDTELPTVTCPANITVNNTAGQCGAVVNFTPTATDNCPGVTITSSPASGSFFPVGLTTVTVTATDASGNIKTCQFTVRVNDTQAPVITCPANITVGNTAGQCGAVVTYAATATDNCPGVTVVLSPASGTFFPVGTTTVTATATDAAGNTATCTFTVRVNDTQLPTIVCPANIVVANTTNQCGAIVTYPAPTFTDNCPGGTVTSSPASGTFFAVGTTTVTGTATDAAGNVSTCTFTIRVDDTQLPVITCPANIIVNPPVGTCTAVVNYTATVTDNCPGATITVISGLPSGSTFPTGVTTVVLQATDASGNTATCSFTVTVNDAQLPVITTQPLPRSACVNDNVTFTVVSTNAVSYQWQLSTNGGGTWTNLTNTAPYSNVTTAAMTVNPVTLAMNGYQFRVLVNGLCRTTTSNAVTLSISNPPTIVLSAFPLTILQPGDVTTLTAVTTPATGGSLVWKKDGVVQAFTGRSLPITVDGIGVWTVTYTDAFGCSATATITISARTTDKMFVYPSPNDGHFHVRINIRLAQYMTLRVIDALGQVLYKFDFNNSVPFFDVQVDLSRYSAGPYWVELLDENGKTVNRKEIIIAH